MSRIDRLSTLIQKEIADILHRRINDPHIGFISITRVRVSPDLEHAWIHYSQIGDDAAKELTLKRLKIACKFIRYELGKVLETKKVPNLRFCFDDSLEKGTEILKKLHQLGHE
ncbi:MAG: 30S ribosome-binding factor RbfA [Candidatus Margulisbacteria bacterium]|nr:30S ribosome-binding factor RbfA [Candidatus Margulisiibacteriota bacterium]